MSNRVLLIFPAMLLPASAMAAPGADASTTLGRDAPQPPRIPEAPKRLPSIQTGSADEIAIATAGDVQIGAVQVTGLSQLSQSDFADIAESFAGRTVDSAGLRVLARAVADRARARGYIFASAAVPPQQLALGIVQVMLDEGAIDAVRITGSANARLAALLEGLKGKAVRKDDAESVLLLAQDIPGVEITSTRYVRENNMGVLVVEARDVEARGSVAVDNWGPASFGPVRARLEFELNGLVDDDDQLVTYTTLTPLQPRELIYVSVRYANILSRGGIQLAVTAGAGRTHERDTATGFEAIGRSRYAALSLSTPMLRSSAANFWLSAEFARQQVTQRFLAAPTQRDDLTTLTLSGWGNVKLGAGRLYGGVSVTQGLGILGASKAGDPASRLDGSGRFTKANAWLNWTGKVAGSVSARLAANGQIASRPLLAPQEMGLGGPFSVRGYDFSERFGDQGASGLAELRQTFDQPATGLNWLQLYGFVDGGYVDNLRGGFGGGTLVSGGGGVRASSGRAEIGLELATPINADRFESGNKSPKLNLVVSYGF